MKKIRVPQETYRAPIPYLFVDASYFKVRDGGNMSLKVLIITGIRDDGHPRDLGPR